MNEALVLHDSTLERTARGNSCLFSVTLYHVARNDQLNKMLKGFIWTVSVLEKTWRVSGELKSARSARQPKAWGRKRAERAKASSLGRKPQDQISRIFPSPRSGRKNPRFVD